MDRIKYILLTLLLGLALARPTLAADVVVQLKIPAGLIRTGDVVPVQVTLDSAGQSVNAADIRITYPTTVLEVDRIVREQAIFTLWPEQPSWDNAHGQLKILGGRPNGIISAGGSVATIYFRVQQSGVWHLMVDPVTSAVYLNDGQGIKQVVTSQPAELTAADQLLSGIFLTSTSHPEPDQWYRQSTVLVSWIPAVKTLYSFRFGQDSAVEADTEVDPTTGQQTYSELEDGEYYFSIRSRSETGTDWSSVTQRRFLIDTVAPEPFTIYQPASRTVNEQRLLVWDASDQTSGVDYYLLSIDGQAGSQRVSSPATYRPEWRGKRLIITAVDRAGNTRQAVWNQAASGSPLLTKQGIGLGILLLVVIGGMIAIRWRRR